jgi:HD-like signal output (HDOD) protein
MRCSGCGSDIPENSRFCNFCGIRVAAIPTNKPAPKDEAPPDPGPSPRKGPVSLSRTERVQACLEKILRSNDLPAFSNHIRSLVGMLNNDDSSLRRLTNIILSDYTLCLEVMRTANSLYYNRSGRSICSVSHAVAMMGADAIYHLANSLRFLEHYLGKSDRLTELLLLSSLTSNHAHHLAKKLLGGRAEEASLCGLLRNLGEILIACYFPEEYAQILRKMKQRNWVARDACLSIMGFSYEDLGKALAKHWKLPDSISEAMEEAPSKNSKESPFHALVSFSDALTNAVYRAEPEATPRLVRALFDQYRSVLNLDHRQAPEILEAGKQQTKDTFSTLKVPLDQLRLERQIALACERGQAEKAPIRASMPADPEPGILIEQLADELDRTLATDPTLDVSQVILMALEAIFRGGPFDRVLLCLVTQDRRELRGRLGFGNEIESVADHFRIPLADASNPIVKGLLSGQDLFAALETAQRLQKSESIRLLKPGSFGLFPISINSLLMGALYFDRIEPAQSLEQETLQTVSRLREIVSLAIARGRIQSGANPSRGNPPFHP